MRELKMKMKSEQEAQRKVMADIKQKQLEIVRLEDKQKVMTDKIKVQKEKGLSPKSSKLAIEQEH